MVPDPEPSTSTRHAGIIGRLVDVRLGEGLSLAISCAYFFCALASFQILRPLREAYGLRGGADKMPWLFTGTMVVAFLVTPLYSRLTARLERRRFIPIVYHVMAGCLVLFFVAFRALPERGQVATAYAFFVWVSVFNVFATTVFWGFMADVWKIRQAERLYGFIGAGGTVGAIAGSQLTAQLAKTLGSAQLLLVSLALLEIAVVCVLALVRIHKIDAPADGAGDAATIAEAARAQPKPAPDVWRGARRIREYAYLRWVTAYTVLYSLVGTFLYMQQSNLVAAHASDVDQRSQLFGWKDTIINSATLLIQVFMTGRLIRWFGVTFALVSQPAVAALGWILVVLALYKSDAFRAEGVRWIGLPPELTVVLGVDILLRVSNFATAKPARESLYTVVERDVKYDSKSFIDTFVYRVSDSVGAWSFQGLKLLSFGLLGNAIATIPLALAWVGVGRALGKKQRKMTESQPPD